MAANLERGAGEAPALEGEARDAVFYRGGHLQIIASAGAGKTEIVSQRIAELLAEGTPADAIVAFTFTERAAASLKTRIERRVARRLGRDFLDRLNGMFVGTIHAYCFALLQRHVPDYAKFDVLDEHRLTAFLTREFYDIGLQRLGPGMFDNIKALLLNLQVIENELLQPDQLEEPLATIYARYLTALEDHRFMTYGQMIAAAVRALEDHQLFVGVHEPLRHLVVDEYQDINPAQERLIRLLSADPVQLCVVGDDDQSIYQWRGSDVGNIVTFRRRYRRVRPFRVVQNRRSRPQIIDAANDFARTIERRLRKRMDTFRPASGAPEVVAWRAAAEVDEASAVADAVRRAHDDYGYRYRDIAILCRGKVAFPSLLAALRAAEVPVQPGGRTGLFLATDADLFGRTICWLVGYGWRVTLYGGQSQPVTLNDLVARYVREFDLSAGQRRDVRAYLTSWQRVAIDGSRPANLIREFYGLLRLLGVHQWDMTNVMLVNRMGTLARCSRVLVDYEATRRRASGADDTGQFRTGLDRGQRYYEWLARYILNWARGQYEDFEGEEDVDLDAVDLTTVHQAKGLEWPVVFVPSLTSSRFPSSKTGQQRNWQVPVGLFNRARYEGALNDERRLFYVALTRARDFVSLSMHERIISRAAGPSPFILRVARVGVAADLPEAAAALAAMPQAELVAPEDLVLDITFSDLALYRRCGLAYRLRRKLQFEAPLAPEVGYGRAVHGVMRRLADHVTRNGAVPTAAELDSMIISEFYLPTATREAYRRMLRLARRLITQYLDNPDYQQDLHRVWEVERPFELHLGVATVSGRADVILDESDGQERLTIVDYKTATQQLGSGDNEFVPHEFQVQVYTSAGRREGLIVDRALVHDLRAGARQEVSTSPDAIRATEDAVRQLVQGMRGRQFPALPGDHCTHCDVWDICGQRQGRRIGAVNRVLRTARRRRPG